MTNITSPKVIIAGAGPAGAVLAFLMARAGITTTLIERHKDFSREFRGELLCRVVLNLCMKSVSGEISKKLAR